LNTEINFIWEEWSFAYDGDSVGQLGDFNIVRAQCLLSSRVALYLSERNGENKATMMRENFIILIFFGLHHHKLQFYEKYFFF